MIQTDQQHYLVWYTVEWDSWPCFDSVWSDGLQARDRANFISQLKGVCGADYEVISFNENGGLEILEDD